MKNKGFWKFAVSLILAVAMCLPTSLAVYAAAPNLTVTGPSSAKPGETFTVSINLNNNTGIAGYTLRVDFDTSKLVLAGVALGEKTATKDLTLNTDQGGSISGFTEVVAGYYGAKNSTASGEYLKVTFKVAQNASAGDARIVASMDDTSDANQKDVAVTSGSKSVKIEATGGNQGGEQGGEQGGNQGGTTPGTSNTIALKRNAKNIKYIKGYSDGTFKPNQAATRYEVVEALSKVFDINYTAKSSGLTDVSSQYKSVVDLFTTAGIINGYPDGTFGGNKTIKRSEFCKIIAVMMNLNIDNPKNSGFKDVSGWAKKYIDACAAAGLVKGKDEAKKLFDPNANITRAELATLVNRITGALDSGTSCKYPDVIKGKWYYGWVAAAAE